MTVGKETDERRENRTGLNQKTRKQGETKSQTVTVVSLILHMFQTYKQSKLRFSQSHGEDIETKFS